MACNADLRVPIGKMMLHTGAHSLKLALARGWTEPFLRASCGLPRINPCFGFACREPVHSRSCTKVVRPLAYRRMTNKIGVFEVEAALFDSIYLRAGCHHVSIK
jgi:hypothetical protein